VSEWEEWQYEWLENQSEEGPINPDVFETVKLPLGRKGYVAIWCGDEIVEALVRPLPQGGGEVRVTVFRKQGYDPEKFPIEGSVAVFSLSMIREMVLGLEHAPHQRVRGIHELVAWLPGIVGFYPHSTEWEYFSKLPPNVARACP
jgi:hypothetical protein